MHRLIVLLLIPGFAAALHAAKVSDSSNIENPTPSEVLAEAFGEKGLDALHRRGFVSLAKAKKGEHIAHVQWPLLKRFEKIAPAYHSFLNIYKKNRKRISVQGSLKNLRLLQRQPIGGLMTPSVRTAVDSLAALLNDADSLDKRLAAAPEDKNLFDAKWGKDFVFRRNASLILTPRKEAGAFFREVLSRHESASASRIAVLKFIQAVYDIDFRESLDTDLSYAKLSSETRKHIANYLADQRLLWTVSETRSRLREIEKTGTLVRDASDIELILAGFEKDGSIEKSLRDSLSTKSSSSSPGSGIRFSGPDLHVHSDDGSATLDSGDTAVVSMAFWIYGVPDGKEVEVIQLAFVDRGTAGIADRTLSTARLKNGGPFTFSVKVPVLTDEPFTFRLLIDSPGAEPFTREIEIQPSPRYHEILSLAAEADREAASCMLNDAVDRYSDVIESLKPLTGKRRFDQLLSSVEDRQRKAQHQSDLHEKLQGAIDGAKLFASKEQCNFRDDRARRALALLADLPAGCDAMPEGASGKNLSEELRELMRLTHQRAEAQEAFRRAVKKARTKETRCKTKEAGSLYAGALALLEADPIARCGDWEQEYSLVRIEDLPRAVGASRLAGSFASAADKAEKRFAKGNAVSALNILLPTLAKIDAMPDSSCYSSSRNRIADLTEAYGIALSPGDPRKTAESAALPKDSTGVAIKTVLAEKTKREKKRYAVRAAQRNEQAPDTATPNGEAR